MGSLRNVWILARNRQGKRVSKEDLFRFCEGMIQKPPLPPELARTFNESFVRSDGQVISLSEWFRKDHFLPALEAIAAQPTWQLQRAECFNRILSETHWRNWYYCHSNAETDLGRAMILSKLRPIWPAANDDELKHFLLQFYLVTLTCSSALTAMAGPLFKLDKAKALEFDLYLQYQRDIIKLDCDIMDLAAEQATDDGVLHVADWKDEHLNPISDQMFRHLASVKDQIVHDNFNAEDFKRIDTAFAEQKRALASQFLSPAAH